MNEKFYTYWRRRIYAPRHMKAIKETGNNLIAAYDPYGNWHHRHLFLRCKFFYRVRKV